MVGDYFKKKQEIEQLKIENEKVFLLKQQEAIKDMQISDNNRAIAGLKATGKYFKYCVFWMISSPFIACLAGHPEYAEQVFKNLEVLPADYRYMYYGIIAIIFGIPVPGSYAGGIWEGIKTAIANRREYKLAKLNRKLYYDTIRKFNGGKPIPQQFVDQQEAVFNEMEGR